MLLSVTGPPHVHSRMSAHMSTRAESNVFIKLLLPDKIMTLFTI
jgi:hypothetical protein